MPRERRGAKKSALVAVVGGSAIVVGSLLTWLDAGGGVSVDTTTVTGTPKGSELLLGQVALGAGIAIVVVGLLLLLFGRARRLFGLLVLLAGIVAIGTGAYVVSAPKDRYVDFAAETAAPAGQVDEVRASLMNLFSASSLTADPGVGVYVAIGGGVVTVAGGLGALFGRRRSKGDDLEPGEAAVETALELEQITDVPPGEEPESPVRETPEPEREPVEEAPHEPPPVVAPTSPEEPPRQEPPTEEPRNRDEWSF